MSSSAPAVKSAEHATKIAAALKGKKKTAEHSARMGATKARSYIVIHPSGVEELITNLREFCRTNNLNQSAMCQIALGNLNHHKQYRCRKVENGKNSTSRPRSRE